DAKKVRGGLLLDSRPGWQRGGDTGRALVPGDPDKSLLVKAVRYEDHTLKMPPKGKLTDKQIAVLADGVNLGATDPRDGAAALAKSINLSQARSHWAYQPLMAVTPPDVRDPSWVRTPIDRFIQARLEARGVHPNSAANRRTLIRRAAFDLTG